MKQQTLMILLFGLSVCIVWGQNNPKEYYEYINEAELACLQMSDEVLREGLCRKPTFFKRFTPVLAALFLQQARSYGRRLGMRPHFGPKRNAMAEMV